jgi:cytochrome c biogenesis protein CcmG, thiol:disulfide interchange protein DsbE
MSRTGYQRRTLPVWPILIAAVVIAGIIAIVLSTTSGGNSNVDTNASGETAPVTIKGAPLPQFQSGADDAAIGRTAPTLTGSTFARKPITIPEADGNAKAIFFVAHWCPHCQAEMPRLRQWLRTHQLPSGLTIEIVSTLVNQLPNNYPPSAWLQRVGLGNIPTPADDAQSDAYEAYGAGGLPYIVYLDKDGKVVLRTEGEYGDDPEIFTDIFQKLAAGQPITDPRT